MPTAAPLPRKACSTVKFLKSITDVYKRQVITRDNVTMMIDTVVFFQVFDAKLFAYGVNRPIQALSLIHI